MHNPTYIVLITVSGISHVCIRVKCKEERGDEDVTWNSPKLLEFLIEWHIFHLHSDGIRLQGRHVSELNEIP